MSNAPAASSSPHVLIELSMPVQALAEARGRAVLHGTHLMVQSAPGMQHQCRLQLPEGTNQARAKTTAKHPTAKHQTTAALLSAVCHSRLQSTPQHPPYVADL